MVERPLRVELFGTPRIIFGGKVVHLEGPPGTFRLFAFLLLVSHDRMDRAIVASSLWPDCPEDVARTNLRRHIAYLEHALDAIGCGIRIAREGSRISLEPPSAITTDVDDFLNAADAGRLNDALSLYRDDLGIRVQDEWIAREREQLRHRRVEILHAYIEQLRMQGETEFALRWARELRGVEPWSEESLRTVMHLRRETGDRIGALQEYRDFSSAVAAAFDAKASQETQSLYQEIANESERLQQAGFLPAETTAFFGREADLQSALAALERSRLVTLVGPPGVGKTRLAIRSGSPLRERFTDGVWFVELASLDDPNLVETRIIETLDRGRPQPERTSNLETRLANKRVLLILDNAEHLLAAVSTCAATLLKGLPDLRMLVTSRAPLAVDGETVQHVHPFQLPQRGTGAEEIAGNAAVQLFIDRASAVSDRASVGQLPLSEVADICCRLDGVPLAIEFAAARMRGMTIRQIKTGLDSRFQLLGQERRTASLQHRTLFASFEWSYRLLSDAERKVFRSLSAFRGGWSTESAGAVATENGRILEPLTALVDNSLVTPPAPQSAEARYDYLESTRAFAAEQLRADPAEHALVLARHASYFAQYFIARDEELRRAHAHQYFAEIDREHDNIRAALAYLIGEGNDIVLGTQLALAVSRYWFDRGYASEGAHWIESALQSSELTGKLRAQALLCLATITRNAGDYAQAYRQFAASLELLRDGGDRFDVIKSLLQLSNVARMMGRFDEATEHAREALQRCEAASDEYFAAFAHATLGCIELAAGGIADAREHFSRALAAFDEKGAGGDAALVVNNLGLCALYSESFEIAAALCQQALERSRLARYDFSIAHSLHSLSLVSIRSGDVQEASTFLERALTIAGSLADRELLVMCLESAAEIALAASEPARAATLAAAADRGRRQYHAPRAPIEEQTIQDIRKRLRERLGSASYEPMQAVGSTLSLDEALEQARSLLTLLRRSTSAERA